jgi:hypothetical protein
MVRVIEGDKASSHAVLHEVISGQLRFSGSASSATTFYALSTFNAFGTLGVLNTFNAFGTFRALNAAAAIPLRASADPMTGFIADAVATAAAHVRRVRFRSGRARRRGSG